MSEHLSPRDCIFHLLVKTAKSGTHRWKQTISDLGLTAVQAKVISFMYESDVLSPGELSNAASIDNASLTGILDRLEAMGIITRQHNASDRRAITLRLTDEGQTLAKEVRTRIGPANQEFLANLSDAETAMLKELLQRL